MLSCEREEAQTAGGTVDRTQIRMEACIYRYGWSKQIAWDFEELQRQGRKAQDSSQRCGLLGRQTASNRLWPQSSPNQSKAKVIPLLFALLQMDEPARQMIAHSSGYRVHIVDNYHL